MSNWWRKIHSTPHAIAEYTSQAKRAKKATGLKVIKVSNTHWKVGKWNVTGEAKSCISSNNSLKCDCPDRTAQETPRSWVGSGAGGFNPCKHVYAVLLKEESNLTKKKAKVTLPDGNVQIFENTPVVIECGGDCDKVRIRYTIYRPWNGNTDTFIVEAWAPKNHDLKILPGSSPNIIWIVSPNNICGPPTFLIGWYFPEGFWAESEIIGEGGGSRTLTIYGPNNAVLWRQNYNNCNYNVECILS